MSFRIYCEEMLQVEYDQKDELRYQMVDETAREKIDRDNLKYWKSMTHVKH